MISPANLTTPIATAQNSSNRLEWLQAARALAAVLVLMYHLRPLISGSAELAPSAKLWDYGLIGVDIFFVISGFVVTRSIMLLPPTLGQGVHFLVKRFLRIFSGYWPALALTVAVTIHLPGNENYPQMKQMWDSIFLLSPNLYDHWLGTAWSLSYELYFYICLCVLFFVVRWGSLYPRLVVAMLVLIAFNGAWYFLDPTVLGLSLIHI